MNDGLAQYTHENGIHAASIGIHLAFPLILPHVHARQPHLMVSLRHP